MQYLDTFACGVLEAAVLTTAASPVLGLLLSTLSTLTIGDIGADAASVATLAQFLCNARAVGTGTVRACSVPHTPYVFLYNALNKSVREKDWHSRKRDAQAT